MSISAREEEVLRHVAEGLTNNEIASAMHLSEETIKSHVKHCLGKLGARNRTHMAVLYVRGQFARADGAGSRLPVPDGYPGDTRLPSGKTLRQLFVERSRVAQGR